MFSGAVSHFLCQDLALFDFHMEELTLRPHCEDQPRKLECRLLQPGENSERPLTPDELHELFNMEGLEEEQDPFADVILETSSKKRMIRLWLRRRICSPSDHRMQMTEEMRWPWLVTTF